MRLALTIVLMALATACAGTSSGGGEQVRPLSVEPDRGFALGPTPVTIRGEGFLARPTQPSSGGAPVVDVKHRVWLDEVELPEVAWVDTRTLQATVPPGLPPGDHRLTVENAFGDRGTLDGAYTVLPAPSLEAALTVDPSAVRVGQMVTVTVTVTNASAANLISLGVGTPLVTSLDGARATVVGGPVPPPPASLAAGQRLTARWTLQAAAAGIVSVTASVTATNPSTGEPVTAASSGASLIQIQDPGSAIVGAVSSPPTPTTARTSQPFDVAVAFTNAGATQITSFAVAAPVISSVDASRVTATGPTPAPPTTLAPGQTVVLSWRLTSGVAGTLGIGFAALGVDSGSRTTVSGSAMISVVVVAPTVLSAVLTTTPSAPATLDVSQAAGVTLAVTNTGGSTASLTAVSPSIIPTTGASCVQPSPVASAIAPLSIAPGATQRFTWTCRVASAGTYTLGATVVATDASSGASLPTPVAGSSIGFTQPPPQALTLVVTKAKGASVSSTPAGIAACDRRCSASFGYGAQVTLTATLGKNASVSWVGCDRTTAPPGAADTCTLSMTSAKIITATFR